MHKIRIRGVNPLEGVVRINGAKNASLPIMAATLLTEGKTILDHVPRLTDVRTMAIVLDSLGVRVERTGPHALQMEVVSDSNCLCPHDLAIKMRASICVLGPLLARRGRAEVPLPGGCVIGERPVDLHLKGLRALGAHIEQKNGYIIAKAGRLRGKRVYMGGPHGSTVLGTANLMMAAVLAKGTTIIEHAASEPEIEDLARYLNDCGALISGAGTHTVRIDGVERLEGTLHQIIADRIEAGTFACAAAITGGDVILQDAHPDHMAALVDTMENMGTEFETEGKDIRVVQKKQLKATDCTALPYPGLPTDMQPQLMAVLSVARGTSVVADSVYPERFTQVGELHRLGADIVRQGPQAVIRGPSKLTGAPVTARDLRGGASLVIAALAADGETAIEGVKHIDRGYESIASRLRAIGADIEREGEPPVHVGQLHLPFRQAAS